MIVRVNEVMNAPMSYTDANTAFELKPEQLRYYFAIYNFWKANKSIIRNS